MSKFSNKLALVTAFCAASAMTASAQLVTVAEATGVVTFDPTELVTPILITAAAGITAGLLGYLLWKGLGALKRGIKAMGS